MRSHMRSKIPAAGVAAGALVWAAVALAADSRTVEIRKITSEGVGEQIGTVTVSQAGEALSLKVAVTGIPAGEHGFHVHETGDCGPAMKDGKTQAGLAAGAHYDPAAKKSHKGPHGPGHEGDLPKLTATSDGIDQTVSAERLTLADIEGRALMIHEGGDTYSDQPESGGGKGRIACGVVGAN